MRKFALLRSGVDGTYRRHTTIDGRREYADVGASRNGLHAVYADFPGALLTAELLKIGIVQQIRAHRLGIGTVLGQSGV